MRFRPWGRLGGLPGSPGTAVVNQGTPFEAETGRIDELLLHPGDTVTFLSQGGGGFGDPFQRDPAAVLWDVRRGLVSAEVARDHYGVAIEDGRIDEEVTHQLRRGRTPCATLFQFGPEREAFETVWTDGLQLALNRSLMQQPLALRNYLKQRAMAEIESRAASGEAPNADGVESVMRQLLESMRRTASAPGHT